MSDTPPREPLHEQLHALPKIELHRHLEGSVRLETLLSIALEHSISLPSVTRDGLRQHVQFTDGEPRTAQQFLGKFTVLRRFYRSEAIIRRIIREVIADAAADNIHYLELRFTPRALNNLLGYPYPMVIEWVVEAAHDAAHAHNIKVRLIVSLNRHEGVEVGQLILDAALRFREWGIVGVDLAGREADVPAETFRQLFARAQEEGLGITIHAGEWASTDGMWSALELGASRIGHGVRAVEDPTLVEELVLRGTPLEVCLTSNIDSGVFADLHHHSLVALYRAGVVTTINTDDPLICNITLTDELERVLTMQPAHDEPLSLDDIKRMQLNAARAAFLSPEECELLVAHMDTALVAF